MTDILEPTLNRLNMNVNQLPSKELIVIVIALDSFIGMSLAWTAPASGFKVGK